MKSLVKVKWFGLIVSLVWAVAGCAQPARDARVARIAELEAELASAQSELLAVQERAHGCDAGAEPSAAVPIESPAETAPSDRSASSLSVAPSDLPVVRLSPGEVQEPTERPSPPEQVSGQRVALSVDADEESTPGPDGTRPVLKVRGVHEAWVYHRPLTSDETSSDNQP